MCAGEKLELVKQNSNIWNLLGHSQDTHLGRTHTSDPRRAQERLFAHASVGTNSQRCEPHLLTLLWERL